jgi:hypothetical protein
VKLEKACKIMDWAEGELNKYGVLGYSAIDIEGVRELYLKVLDAVDDLATKMYSEVDMLKAQGEYNDNEY